MPIQKGFTLLEVLIVVLILGILSSLALPTLQGAIIKSRMSELLATVAGIERTEYLFYLESEEYAAQNDGITGNDLPYSTTQANIDNFSSILGIDIPGMNSIFVYGVYYALSSESGQPTSVYVRVRDHFSDWGILCRKVIQGPNKGKWQLWHAHPWYKYLKATLPK